MRRLLFCDHSYRKKTRSTDFLIELLRRRYEVGFLWDDSWRGGAGPSAYQINRHDCDALLFFQTINPRIIPDLACRNILCVPMYDAMDIADEGVLGALGGVGIVAFCRAAYEAIASRRGDSFYLQYFPDPSDFDTYAARGSGLFFWQRSPAIGWPEVARLAGEAREFRPVHMHLASDPGNAWARPVPRDESEFRIEYSRWFETREDYLRAVGARELYIAPRVKEGIGFSFLEAMAMGRVVIANDAPTMSEYISDGHNGYLFDARSPERLVLGDTEAVGRAARESARTGRARWEREAAGLLDYIDSRMASGEAGRLPRRGGARLLALHALSRLSAAGTCAAATAKAAIKNALPYGLVKRREGVQVRGIAALLPYGLVRSLHRAI